MIRSTALLLTLLTGFSGLVYEVAWQKSLAILLGSHSEATAAVLGIFLGGLSVGYALFGRVTRLEVDRARAAGQPPRLLLIYGSVEIAIGLWALLFTTLFSGALVLSLRVPPEPEGLAFAVDVLLTALLIGPPTVLMGGTIPILTQSLAHGLKDATRFHAFVYGFNTAGAFAGALAGGFFLIPLLGIPGTLQWMGAINITAGAVFLALHMAGRGVAAPADETLDSPPQGFALYAGVACLIGFATMSLQTVLIRVGGLAFGASHFTFAMVVAVFVLCIALGSFVVSAFDRIPRAAPAVCLGLLAILLTGLYAVLDDSGYWVHLLRTIFRDTDSAFYPFWLAAFLGMLALLAVPVGLSGASLPLLFHEVRRESGDLGRMAGRLYSWNTVGNLLGALLGGYALLFWMDLHHVYRLAIAALVVAVALLGMRIHGMPRAVLAAGLVPVLGAVFLLPEWDAERLSSGLFRRREAMPATHRGADATFRAMSVTEIPFHDDDPTATVVVKRLSRAGTDTLAIVTNGKSDGNLGPDYPTMALISLVSCLLAERCEDAFIIGYGTGVTAGELAALDSARNVVVAEISPGVIEAAPLFDYGNQRASRNPKVHIVRSDAYRALLRSEGTFDVIASEPSNPWVTGVEMLFSREFLEAARDRLSPGGVYAQWFHAYETDEATLELVLRTYTSVFDQVAVWFTLGPDMMLFGLNGDRSGDLARIEARMSRPDFRAGLKRAGVESLPALLAHELLPAGVVNAVDLDPEVHTLMHPLLSHRAARAFFRGKLAQLPVSAGLRPARLGARNSLLRQYAARSGGRLDDEARGQVVRTLCDGVRPECATALAGWIAADPDSSELAAVREAVRRNPGVAEHVAPDTIDRLVRLFRIPEHRGFYNRRYASLLTDLFERYYHHAEPFQRSALDDVWRRCRDTRCAAGRTKAEDVLGDLSLDVAPGLPAPPRD